MSFDSLTLGVVPLDGRMAVALVPLLVLDKVLEMRFSLFDLEIVTLPDFLPRSRCRKKLDFQNPLTADKLSLDSELFMGFLPRGAVCAPEGQTSYPPQGASVSPCQGHSLGLLHRWEGPVR